MTVNRHPIGGGVKSRGKKGKRMSGKSRGFRPETTFFSLEKLGITKSRSGSTLAISAASCAAVPMVVSQVSVRKKGIGMMQ